LYSIDRLLASQRRSHTAALAQVAVGEDVRVVGYHEELGAWDAAQGLSLQWHPGHVWKGSVILDPSASFNYKLVKASADCMHFEWEEGEDRSLDLQELRSDGISVSVLWGCPAVHSAVEPFAKACALLLSLITVRVELLTLLHIPHVFRTSLKPSLWVVRMMWPRLSCPILQSPKVPPSRAPIQPA
jgi:Starch binding domain